MVIFYEKIEKFRFFWIFYLSCKMHQNHRKTRVGDVLRSFRRFFQLFWSKIGMGLDLRKRQEVVEDWLFLMKKSKIFDFLDFLFGLRNASKPSKNVFLWCFGQFLEYFSKFWWKVGRGVCPGEGWRRRWWQVDDDFYWKNRKFYDFFGMFIWVAKCIKAIEKSVLKMVWTVLGA